MNIFDYTKYYCDYTFSDKSFNEVDNVIFSMLAYNNFEGIVKKNEKNKVTIEEASKLFFEKYTIEEIKNNILAVREASKLLKLVSKTKRFKDIKMSNYTYVSNSNCQFSAVTFNLYDNTYYVAFEGTDELLSGWQEDCEMAYKFPVEAHTLSKKYLDKHFTVKRCNLIIGGHSKGGNLAMVSAMYANYFVKNKIIKVYSNDGQGLRKAQIDSKFYKKIEDKFIHIIPNYSIVGLLLRHTDNYIVVKSNKKGLLAHDATTWQVSYDHFEKEKLSRFSKVFDEGFSTWLDKYDDEKRRLFVKNVFKIIKENNIESLTEVRLKKELIENVLKSSKNIDPLVKEMLVDLLKVVNKTNLEYPLF